MPKKKANPVQFRHGLCGCFDHCGVGFVVLSILVTFQHRHGILSQYGIILRNIITVYSAFSHTPRSVFMDVSALAAYWEAPKQRWMAQAAVEFARHSGGHNVSVDTMNFQEVYCMTAIPVTQNRFCLSTCTTMCCVLPYIYRRDARIQFGMLYWFCKKKSCIVVWHV